MMGISLYLIIKPDNGMLINKKALTVFGFQLGFNILWSAAFFGLRSPLAGLIVISILWFLILFNIVEFYKISRASVILLIPYILWVSFASVLNFEYWRLN
jgi:tryptophan-rich sensory protein